MSVESSYSVVYPQIADRIREQLPGLGWIDLDQGQLEQEGEDYPLPYDAGVCLIDFDEVDWEDLSRGVQRGEAQIRITLAVQVVQDTYQHSSQREAALQKLRLLSQVHAALQHYAGDGFGAMVRIKSGKGAASQPGLWVYSQIYKARLHDASGEQGGSNVATDLDTTPRGDVAPTITLR